MMPTRFDFILLMDLKYGVNCPTVRVATIVAEKIATRMMEMNIQIPPTSFPARVFGTKSPYPTVLRVLIAHHKPFTNESLFAK